MRLPLPAAPGGARPRHTKVKDADGSEVSFVFSGACTESSSDNEPDPAHTPPPGLEGMMSLPLPAANRAARPRYTKPTLSDATESSTVCSVGCTESSSGKDPEPHTPPPGLEGAVDTEPRTIGSTRSPATAPRYVHDFRLSSLDWDDLARNREQRSSLHLRGLPLRLCHPEALMSLMKERGLADAVDSIEVPQQPAWKPKVDPRAARRTKFGCMTVHLKSASEVRPIAIFFHGRLLDGRMPVAVSFAPLHAPTSSLLRGDESPEGTPIKLAAILA